MLTSLRLGPKANCRNYIDKEMNQNSANKEKMVKESKSLSSLNRRFTLDLSQDLTLDFSLIRHSKLSKRCFCHGPCTEVYDESKMMAFVHWLISKLKINIRCYRQKRNRLSTKNS